MLRRPFGCAFRCAGHLNQPASFHRRDDDHRHHDEPVLETRARPVRTYRETLVGSVGFDVPSDQPMKVAYAPVLKDLVQWS
jgi:hypothetical protein